MLVALAASAHADQPIPARGEMKVTLVEGDVKVTPKGGAPAVVAAASVLHEGDLVRTGPDSRVEVQIATGTKLRIGPSAQAELREAPPAGGRFRLKLAVGNLWAHVAKLLTGDRFEIETENGVAGVRGTEFTVGAAGDGKGDDLLRVYQGAVQCDHIGGKWSKRLEPGKELLFHRERPTTLRGFDVAEQTPLRDWRAAPKESPSKSGAAAPAKDGVKDEPKGGEKDEKKDDRKDEKRDEKRDEKKDKKSFKDRVKVLLKKE
jgi:ferric-dicitrate binding protein FerR (iron transport regulator)